MSTRNLLRDTMAGLLVAVLLVAVSAGSHAQVALWQKIRTGTDELRTSQRTGMERTVMRAESPDHVRAQIERMEARAKADDRLNGRGNQPQGSAGERQPAAAKDAAADTSRGETRPSGVGPGWQGHERETNR